MIEAPSTARTRKYPLENRRFRTLLLVVTAVPIGAIYVWRTVVLPIIAGGLPADFSANYLAAAARIASGKDPYDLCVITGCGPATGLTPCPWRERNT